MAPRAPKRYKAAKRAAAQRKRPTEAGAKPDGSEQQKVLGKIDDPTASIQSNDRAKRVLSDVETFYETAKRLVMQVGSLRDLIKSMVCVAQKAEANLVREQSRQAEGKAT